MRYKVLYIKISWEQRKKASLKVLTMADCGNKEREKLKDQKVEFY